jgi:hypothetical protein
MGKNILRAEMLVAVKVEETAVAEGTEEVVAELHVAVLIIAGKKTPPTESTVPEMSFEYVRITNWVAG